MSSFAALPSLPSLDLPSIPFSFAVPPSYDHPSISSNSSNNHHGHPSGDLRGSGAGGGAGVHHHHHPHARRWARPTARVLASSLAASTSAGSIRASDMGRGSRAWAEANARGGIARALEGRGPLGTDLVLEERDLSDEEAEFDLKNQACRDFGRTFLKPFGCSKTQEEIDAVHSRSPSPSPPSNAEDLNHANHVARSQTGGEDDDLLVSEDDIDEQPDLDADLTDEDEVSEEEVSVPAESDTDMSA